MNLALGDCFQSREPISCAHFTAASSLMTQEQPLLLTLSNSGILKTQLVLPGLPLTQEKLTFETLKRIHVCTCIVSIHMRAGVMYTHLMRIHHSGLIPLSPLNSCVPLHVTLALSEPQFPDLLIPKPLSQPHQVLSSASAETSSLPAFSHADPSLPISSSPC